MTDVRQLSLVHPTSPSTPYHIVDFRFELPRSASHPDQVWWLSSATNTEGPTQFNVLPSSLDAESSGIIQNSGSRACASVVYEVQARVICGRSIIAEAVREVQIFDSPYLYPPICIEDFAPEYVCEQLKALKKNLFSNRGTLSIVTEEPAPFEFSCCQDHATTKLPISFLLQVSNGQGDRLPPFDLVSEVSWRLKASTFVMMRETTCSPTIQQAFMSPSIAECTSLRQSKTFKLAWSQWEETTLYNEFKHEKAWTAKQTIWLSTPTSCLLPPTFCTPYLLRRYSISLRIRVRGIGRVNARFNIPVQITYRSAPVASPLPRCHIPSSSVQEGVTTIVRSVGQDPDLDLPAYVP